MDDPVVVNYHFLHDGPRESAVDGGGENQISVLNNFLLLKPIRSDPSAD